MKISYKKSMQEIASEQLEEAKQVYILSPKRMLSEYKGEKENVKNYKGRQLLEMLQNADDAASEAPMEKKVLIKLVGKQLIIANTGHPFTEEGLESIFHSHLSPKEAQQKQIGKKGLGFRSILSWADRVTIKSHRLNISFSETYSKSVFEELLLDEKFALSFNRDKSKYKWLPKTKEAPISILACPELISDLTDSLKDYSRYDTIILIDLKNDSLEDVSKQIKKDLDAEVLLFLNFLEQIELDINGEVKKFSKEKISKSKIELTTIDSTESEQGHSKIWNINSSNGTFNELAKDYQLSIAWKDELDEAKDVLYSYFRTKVNFDFKGILHGTFELNADRNDILQEEEYNKKLIELLPNLIADTAVKIANNEKEITNYKATFFTIFENEKLPAIIKESDFLIKLKDVLTTKKILPTISNKYYSIEDGPVYYKNENFAKLLPKDEFPGVLTPNNNESIAKYIDSLETKIYTFNYVCQCICEKAKQFSIRDYALLISGLIDYATNKTEYDYSLFYDSAFEPLLSSKPIFLPSKDISLKLPSQVGVQVINKDLAHELKLIFDAESYQSLSEKLRAYLVKIFNFNEIIELLISHFNSVKTQIDEIKELHQYIFHLYKSEKHPSNWEGSPIPLISKRKRIKKANELYFGKQYGCLITDAIYSYDKDKFVAIPKEYSIDEDDYENWKSYLKWIGVAELPRKIQQRGTRDFGEYVFKKFDYKNKIGWDRKFNNFKEFDTSLSYYGEIKVQSIDDFENIVAKNDCETIVAWLGSDSNIYELLEADHEPEGSEICTNFGNNSYDRVIKGRLIRNFIKWQLSNLDWVNTFNNKRQPPNLCTFSATITSEFSPLIEKPNVNYDAYILKANNFRPDKVDYILNLVGVNKTISSFETKTLYSILNNLPQIDSDGRKAKTLYRELAVNYDEKNLNANEPEYQRFLSEGKVFCKKNEAFSYENRDSVFYVDNKRYGESIVNQFFTIEIEKRRSIEKIEKVFGVRSLKGLKLNLANIPTPHILNAKFEQEIEFFKPYVYVFRQDLDTTGRERSLIKEIKFRLVNDLSVLLDRDKESLEFNLSNYEYLFLQKEKTIYIKTPGFVDDERKLKEDVTFCSTIAEAFSALINVDAQRQQIRELFSKSAAGRDDLIRAELDDTNLEKLILAKEKLGIVNDPKIQFWTSFIKCFPKKKPNEAKITDEVLLLKLTKAFPKLTNIISYVFERINYENYNEEDSLRLIIELLKNSQLSLADFNKYVYPTIDISDLYYLDFKRIKESKKLHFKQSLYSQFINSDKDKRKFLSCLSQYDSLTGKFQNDIRYDIEADLISQLLEQFDIELSIKNQFSFEDIYNSNWKIFEAEAEEQKISRGLIDQFINENPEFESLLFFTTELDSLLDQLKNWIPKPKENAISGAVLAQKRVTIGNADFLFNDFRDLFHQLESNGVFQTTLSKIVIKNATSGTSQSGKKRGPSYRNSSGSNQIHENIGFLGEWLVYKHLMDSIKNRESIKWVSEYAKLAGVNADGKNGCGYDIEYIPNDARYPRYVEVKVVGWEDAFRITSNEILQGEKLKKYYEIFLVRNIGQSNDISIEIIQGPFHYKGKNTFHENGLFTVVNDSFILKFEKTDA